MEAVRAAMPDNVYWKMAAPTKDPELLSGGRSSGRGGTWSMARSSPTPRRRRRSTPTSPSGSACPTTTSSSSSTSSPTTGTRSPGRGSRCSSWRARCTRCASRRCRGRWPRRTRGARRTTRRAERGSRSRRLSIALEAEEVRKPAGARVDVHRADQHLGVLVEDRLRAVAVDGRPRPPRRPGTPSAWAEPRGGRRGVVEVAGAPEAVARDVMAGRATARVGGGRAGQHEVGRRHGHVHRGARGLPGAGPDERHRVVGELPGAGGHRRGGDRGLVLGKQPGVREQVGHDPVCPGSSRRPAASQSSQARAR